MKKNEIRKIASDLINTVGTNDVNDIATFLNIEVNKNGSETFCYRLSNNKKIIVLDKNIPDELTDFVLAHELGHAVLHDTEIEYYSPLAVDKTQTEREADYFAFLLLEKEIDPAFNYTLTQYANLLGTNEEVIKYVLD